MRDGDARGRDRSPGWASTFVEIDGTVGEPARRPPDAHAHRLLLQVPARPRRQGLRRRRRRSSTATATRRPARLERGGRRRSSCATRRFDPVADLPVRRGCVEHHAGRAAQRPARRDRRPGARPSGCIPFVHQRYDDLSPIGDGLTAGDRRAARQGRGGHRRRQRRSGRAMGERFARRGHARGARPTWRSRCSTRRWPSCAADGLDVRRRARPTSPTSPRSRRCATQAYERIGAVHVVCNNAGVGAGAEGQMWDHTAQRLGLGARRQRVGGDPRHQGVRAGHARRAARSATWSTRRSGNGGIAPLPGTPIYALTKSSVVTLSPSALYAQLQPVDATACRPRCCSRARNVLRTGLFTSWRNRPPELRQPGTPAPTADHDSRPSRSRWPTAGIAARLHAGRGGGRPRGRRHPRRHSSGSCRRASAATSRSGPGPTRCSTAPTPTYLRDVTW